MPSRMRPRPSQIPNAKPFHPSVTPLTVGQPQISNMWASLNEKLDPDVPILRPTPTQTRRANKILERKLNQTPITRQPTPKGTNDPALCETDPQREIQKHLPAAPPRVNPKETPPEVHPISRRTRSHTQNSQPPIDLRTRA